MNMATKWARSRAHGPVFIAVAALRGARFPTHATQWKHMLTMSVLTILITNGINNWSIQWVPGSGAGPVSELSST